VSILIKGSLIDAITLLA